MVGGIDEVTTSMVDWDSGGGNRVDKARQPTDGRSGGHARGREQARGGSVASSEMSHLWFSWSEATWAAANNRSAFWMTS